MRHHSIRLAATLGALLLLLTGCGSAMNGSSPQRSSSGAAYESAAPSDGGYRENWAVDKETSGESGDVSLSAAVSRKQIYNAELTIEVQNVDDALQKATAAAEANDGYVQESQQSGTREDGRRLTIKLRVPWQSFRSVVTTLSALGEVRSRREWTQDVTEEYVDLEARIAAKETHLEQLRSLYSQSGTLTEMMALQEEIDRVTAELESMKGRMRVLSDQVALSTITVSFYEAGTGEPERPVTGVWERMTVGFKSSWRSGVRGLGDLAVAIAMLLPVLLFLGAVVLVGCAIYLIVRGVRKRPSKAKPPAAPPTAPPAAPPAETPAEEENNQ